MKITITLGEALKKCNWAKFCEMFGWDPYCINEGIDPETEQILTIEQAKELGLL